MSSGWIPRRLIVFSVVLHESRVVTCGSTRYPVVKAYRIFFVIKIASIGDNRLIVHRKMGSDNSRPLLCPCGFYGGSRPISKATGFPTTAAVTPIPHSLLSRHDAVEQLASFDFR